MQASPRVPDPQPGVRIIGERTSDAALRVPTISFTVEGHSSREIVSAIDRHGLGIRHGDFYARRLSEHLGLDPADGVVRVSMVHYNTIAEVDKLVSHLEPLL